MMRISMMIVIMMMMFILEFSHWPHVAAMSPFIMLVIEDNAVGYNDDDEEDGDDDQNFGK